MTMRQFETTSTIKQSDACIPKQFAHRLYAMNVAGLLSAFLIAIGVMIGVGSMQDHPEAGWAFMAIMVLAAAICIPVTSMTVKKAAAQMHPTGDGVWTNTTWFENDGIHRTDEDGDEVVFHVNKLVCAYRAGHVLLLCTRTQSLVPVNLAQLTETERKSVFVRIKTECPRLKMVKMK